MYYLPTLFVCVLGKTYLLKFLIILPNQPVFIGTSPWAGGKNAQFRMVFILPPLIAMHLPPDWLLYTVPPSVQQNPPDWLLYTVPPSYDQQSPPDWLLYIRPPLADLQAPPDWLLYTVPP